MKFSWNTEIYSQPKFSGITVSGTLCWVGGRVLTPLVEWLFSMWYGVATVALCGAVPSGVGSTFGSKRVSVGVGDGCIPAYNRPLETSFRMYRKGKVPS